MKSEQYLTELSTRVGHAAGLLKAAENFAKEHEITELPEVLSQACAEIDGFMQTWPKKQYAIYQYASKEQSK